MFHTQSDVWSLDNSLCLLDRRMSGCRAYHLTGHNEGIYNGGKGSFHTDNSRDLLKLVNPSFEDFCSNFIANENAMQSSYAMSNACTLLRTKTHQISGQTDHEGNLDKLTDQASSGHHFFGGALENCTSFQDGFTSLGFATDNNPLDSPSQEDDHCSPVSNEGLPEIFDSFESIPYSTISNLETLPAACHLSQPQVNQTPTHVNKWNNYELFDMSKQIEHIRLNTNYSITTNTSFFSEKFVSVNNNLLPIKDDNVPVYVDIQYVPVYVDIQYTYLQQAAQGGSGNLSFVTVIDNDFEDDDEDSLQNNQTKSSNVNPKDLFQPREDNNPSFLSRTSRLDLNFAESENEVSSIFDGPNGRKLYYAAFLCCPFQDLPLFGIAFHTLLQSWGFRIFLPPRDLLLTGSNFDNMFRALNERCNGKIIVVLSVNYKASEECTFTTLFARALDPDSKKRNIIAVQIDKHVGIKKELKGLTIIQYNQNYKSQWLKKKLVEAIAA